MTSQDEQIQQRRANLDAIEKLGIDAYPRRFERRHTISELVRSYGEQPILFGDWLDHSSTVVSIGSTVPAQREIDVSVVSACDLIVCDAVDVVILHRTGHEPTLPGGEISPEYEQKLVEWLAPWT